MYVYRVQEFLGDGDSLFLRKEDAMAYAEKEHKISQYRHETWDNDEIYYDKDGESMIQIEKVFVNE